MVSGAGVPPPPAPAAPGPGDLLEEEGVCVDREVVELEVGAYSRGGGWVLAAPVEGAVFIMLV